MLLNDNRFKVTTHIRKFSRREVTESPLILHTLLGQYRILEVLDSTFGPKMSYSGLSL
jgi:phenylalanine-4-hydroxylase